MVKLRNIFQLTLVLLKELKEFFLTRLSLGGYLTFIGALFWIFILFYRFEPSSICPSGLSKKLFQDCISTVPKYLTDTGLLALFVMLIIILLVIIFCIRFVIPFFIRLVKMTKDATNQREIKFKRYEDLTSKDILFAGVPYIPYYEYQESAANRERNHSGIGFAVLKEIFYQNLKETDQKMEITWQNLLDGLRESKFDVIATPLFETRTRICDEKDIAFSAPLFYANIGIYVNKEKWKNFGKLTSGGGTYKEVCGFLEQNKNDLELICVNGEIAERFAEKRNMRKPIDKNVLSGASDNDFKNVLEQIENNTTLYTLMEVSKASNLAKTHNYSNVVNILGYGQLQYPVCLVFRRKEVALKNYINQELMNMRTDGRLRKIIKDQAISFFGENLTNFDFNRYYQMGDDSKNRIYNSKFVNEVYDKFNNAQLNALNETKKRFLGVDQFQANINVLEIGYGAGDTTQKVLETFGNNGIALIDLVDHSSRMYHQFMMNRKTWISFYDCLKLHNNDALLFLREQTDNKYHLIVSALTLHNINKHEREKIFKEIWRVLKPKGIFLYFDKICPDNPSAIQSQLKDRINLYLDKHLPKLLAGNYSDEVELTYWLQHYVKDLHNELILKIGDFENLKNSFEVEIIYNPNDNEDPLVGILSLTKNTF